MIAVLAVQPDPVPVSLSAVNCPIKLKTSLKLAVNSGTYVSNTNTERHIWISASRELPMVQDLSQCATKYFYFLIFFGGRGFEWVSDHACDCRTLAKYALEHNSLYRSQMHRFVSVMYVPTQRVSLCAFISRNVSKGAGCLTSCCTKKQVCPTDRCQFCTLFSSSSLVDVSQLMNKLHVILVHSTGGQVEVLQTTTCVYIGYRWCSIRGRDKREEQMISLDCELTQWCQML